MDKDGNQYFSDIYAKKQEVSMDSDSWPGLKV